MSSKSLARIDDGRPTVQELRGEHPMAEAAKRWWLRERPAKFNPDKLKAEIYDVLEDEEFGKKSLLVLENLQFLEKYLWPNFSESASDFHVVLIALMVNVKRREEAPIWEHLSTSPENFTVLFRRILHMAQDTTIDLIIRSHLLSFIVTAFQSLDSVLVRKEVAPLVNIGIWNNFSSVGIRNEIFEKYPQTKKVWRANVKRFESLDEEGQIRVTFERTWLTKMIAIFFNLLWQPTPEDTKAVTVSVYCERFIELLCDLESQLPTRRYLNLLLKDLNVLTAIQLSPLVAQTEDTLLRDLLRLLDHYVYFAIDDLNGEQLSANQVRDAHNSVLSKLQRVSFKNFNEKLKLLALANFGVLGTREELMSHFADLTDEELVDLCKKIGLRTSYPKGINIPITRGYLTEVLLCVHERRVPFQEEMRSIPVLPNERALAEVTALSERPYDGSRPLALPKLNLQYLTVGDFLWRSFILYRHEAYFGIRRNIEDALKRLNPKIRYPSMETSFHGTHRMALTVGRPAIMEVLPPKVGEDCPASVRVEINLDLSRASNDVREGWESLRPDDIVFLLAVKGVDEGTSRNEEISLTEKYGIKALRSAAVAQVLDRENRPLRLNENQAPRYSRGFIKLHLFVDAEMFVADTTAVKDGKPDIYDSINLIIRRKPRENNFKPILESIKSLATSDAPLPSWLSEVFLGFGDPTSAINLADRKKTIDFRDTFLDWQHLVSSFPDKTLIPVNGATEGCPPPYVLNSPSAPAAKAPSKSSKKRRRDQIDADPAASNTLEVTTYTPPNMGPYPTDIPRRNKLCFTPSQSAAIASGTNTGLTIVVGPPGTGKTDVATQVISNIYHMDKNERILLVAHSNQALNQLFEKITKLDIDERHLLRLGHGEDGVVTFSGAGGNTGWGKKGRVESFMKNRAGYLAEVDRLAASLGAPGAHGDSCETAGYFDQVYILPAWKTYQSRLSGLGASPTSEEIMGIYPFNQYFSNAPEPMFPSSLSATEAIEVAEGGYRHIRRIFSELEDLRPFELLPGPRERQNYLLAKEARIIAMTSTHAAIKRAAISKLNFSYTSLILEEAAQITELETFIPLCLGGDKGGNRLHRLLLLGDHLQNSPILQHISLKSFTNLSQSLFLRLIRVGAPTITLHHQARSRPEIAELVSWRYDHLSTLPAILTRPEFQIANPGFARTVQFINVPDYRGAGESRPGEEASVQNLGEAEYAVAVYQYMRLLGYPREKITILTPYAGQRGLIREVLQRRCSARGLETVFGMPNNVATVDKYQGEQNDYIILSLTRTSRIGYLRDMRRMTVALSRARLGLYVLGRREVFESCFELQEAWKRLVPKGRGEKLELVTGEVYGSCTRKSDDEVEPVVMEGVEHLGKYVWEMTQTVLERRKQENIVKMDVDQEADATLIAEADEDEEGDEEGGEGEDGAAEVEMVDV